MRGINVSYLQVKLSGSNYILARLERMGLHAKVVLYEGEARPELGCSVIASPTWDSAISPPTKSHSKIWAPDLEQPRPK